MTTHEIQRAVSPHLPAPANGLRRQRPTLDESIAALERRAQLDYRCADPLLVAVEDHVFTLLPADQEEHWSDVLLWVDRKGSLHADLGRPDAPADLDEVVKTLADRQPDRFALLTCQLASSAADVVALLGAPPARTDAVVTTVQMEGSARRRMAWREPDDSAPMRCVERIMRYLANGQGAL